MIQHVKDAGGRLLSAQLFQGSGLPAVNRHIITITQSLGNQLRSASSQHSVPESIYRGGVSRSTSRTT